MNFDRLATWNSWLKQEGQLKYYILRPDVPVVHFPRYPKTDCRKL
jgi:hypothetical protein